MSDPGLTKAIKAAGSASELARKLGIKPSAVLQWKRVPSGRVVDVERITGVSRAELLPKLYETNDAASPVGEAA